MSLYWRIVEFDATTSRDFWLAGLPEGPQRTPETNVPVIVRHDEDEQGTLAHVAFRSHADYIKAINY